MKKILLIVLICITGCFSSCSFVRDDKIVGRYYISSVDVYEEPCLAYKLEEEYQICIVESKILAYYKNEEYIFIKQSPSGVNNSLVINYYIIPIVKDNPAVFPEDIIIGPLNEQKFNKEISKMNLTAIKFTKVD